MLESVAAVSFLKRSFLLCLLWPSSFQRRGAIGIGPPLAGRTLPDHRTYGRNRHETMHLTHRSHLPSLLGLAPFRPSMVAIRLGLSVSPPFGLPAEPVYTSCDPQCEHSPFFMSSFLLSKRTSACGFPVELSETGIAVVGVPPSCLFPRHSYSHSSPRDPGGAKRLTPLPLRGRSARDPLRPRVRLRSASCHHRADANARILNLLGFPATYVVY